MRCISSIHSAGTGGCVWKSLGLKTAFAVTSQGVTTMNCAAMKMRQFYFEGDRGRTGLPGVCGRQGRIALPLAAAGLAVDGNLNFRPT